MVRGGENMNLSNPFPLEVKVLYLYRTDCTKCGSNRILELHHILGRISSSAFNACLLCRKCHNSISYKEAPVLFQLNLRFLYTTEFQPTADDIEFLTKNRKQLGL